MITSRLQIGITIYLLPAADSGRLWGTRPGDPAGIKGSVGALRTECVPHWLVVFMETVSGLLRLRSTGGKAGLIGSRDWRRSRACLRSKIETSSTLTSRSGIAGSGVICMSTDWFE
jgi:hypothetical protein